MQRKQSVKPIRIPQIAPAKTKNGLMGIPNVGKNSMPTNNKKAWFEMNP